MKPGIKKLCFCSLMIVFVGLSLKAAPVAQDNEIDKKEVDAVLDKARIDDEDKKYILANLNRTEISTLISKWEAANETRLSKRARAETVVEYFRAESHYRRFHSKDELEQAGKRAMTWYLDDIKNSQYGQASFQEHYRLLLGWHGITGIPPRYSYGRLKVASVPDKSEVYIDSQDRFLAYSDKTFMLTVGEHSVWVKKSGYKDYADKVSIEAGKDHTLECNLTSER